MAYNNAYSWPSASTDFHLWTENTGFDPRLVESTDMKPGQQKANCIITARGGELMYNWTQAIQTYYSSVNCICNL